MSEKENKSEDTELLDLPELPSMTPGSMLRKFGPGMILMTPPRRP